jgi:hypothetical protein
VVDEIIKLFSASFDDFDAVAIAASHQSVHPTICVNGSSLPFVGLHCFLRSEGFGLELLQQIFNTHLNLNKYTFDLQFKFLSNNTHG